MTPGMLHGPRRAPRESAPASSPARHCDRGLRWTTVSVMLSGDGSVEVSARPTLATAYSTSGTRSSAPFCRSAMRVFSSSEMLGSAIGMNSRSPSSSGGMNSLPICVAVKTAPAEHDERGGDGQPRRARARRAAPDGRPRPSSPHHRVVALGVDPAAQEERAQHGHERHRHHRGGEDREGLREGERVEELPFLSGQRKDRHEGQHDDGHREEDGPAHQTRGFAARSDGRLRGPADPRRAVRRTGTRSR